jgi:hypothetical protein
MRRLASLVVYKRGVGVDTPEVYGNGTRLPWREPSSRVWTAKTYRETGIYVAPVVGSPITSPWLFWGTNAGQ